MMHQDGSSTYQIILLTNEDLKKNAESHQQQISILKQYAPDFILKSLTGETISLKQFKGKIVVLNFWFTSCAPCREEMPLLNKIKSEFESKGVVFIGLPLDKAQQVVKFLASTPFNYMQLPEAGKVHVAYKVESCPTSVVIDKKGIISFIQITGQDINSTLPAAIQVIL
jgi:peroxiredoxin